MWLFQGVRVEFHKDTAETGSITSSALPSQTVL